MTQQQLDNCLGSSTYLLCHEKMETHLAQSSCLATLYFHTPVVALSLCPNLNDASLLTSEEKEGWRLCIISIECGIQLITKNIKIRPDILSCQKMPATRVDFKLADPLQHFISSLPEIENHPCLKSRNTNTLKKADL